MTAVKTPRGIRTSMLRRLFRRAPRTTRQASPGRRRFPGTSILSFPPGRRRCSTPGAAPAAAPFRVPSSPGEPRRRPVPPRSRRRARGRRCGRRSPACRGRARRRPPCCPGRAAPRGPPGAGGCRAGAGRWSLVEQIEDPRQAGADLGRPGGMPWASPPDRGGGAPVEGDVPQADASRNRSRVRASASSSRRRRLALVEVQGVEEGRRPRRWAGAAARRWWSRAGARTGSRLQPAALAGRAFDLPQQRLVARHLAGRLVDGGQEPGVARRGPARQLHRRRAAVEEGPPRLGAHLAHGRVQVEAEAPGDGLEVPGEGRVPRQRAPDPHRPLADAQPRSGSRASRSTPSPVPRPSQTGHMPS